MQEKNNRQLMYIHKYVTHINQKQFSLTEEETNSLLQEN